MKIDCEKYILPPTTYILPPTITKIDYKKYILV